MCEYMRVRVHPHPIPFEGRDCIDAKKKSKATNFFASAVPSNFASVVNHRHLVCACDV